MKLAVISDLHLGTRDAADIFGHDDAEFLRFLTYLESNFERIVLLGDIYETLTCASPFAQAAEYERCRAAHAEIAKRFDRSQYTFLHGNHDLVCAEVTGAPESLSLEVDGTRLLFTHGHGFDFVERYARRATELGVWVTGWMWRAGLGPICKAMHQVDVWKRGASEDPRRCKFQRWAIDLARRKQADVVITGHTHQGVVAEHGDRLFLNSGSCAEGKFSFLSMDTATGTYAVNNSW